MKGCLENLRPAESGTSGRGGLKDSNQKKDKNRLEKPRCKIAKDKNGRKIFTTERYKREGGAEQKGSRCRFGIHTRPEGMTYRDESERKAMPECKPEIKNALLAAIQGKWKVGEKLPTRTEETRNCREAPCHAEKAHTAPRTSEADISPYGFLRRRAAVGQAGGLCLYTREYSTKIFLQPIVQNMHQRFGDVSDFR